MTDLFSSVKPGSRTPLLHFHETECLQQPDACRKHIRTVEEPHLHWPGVIWAEFTAKKTWTVQSTEHGVCKHTSSAMEMNTHMKQTTVRNSAPHPQHIPRVPHVQPCPRPQVHPEDASSHKSPVTKLASLSSLSHPCYFLQRSLYVFTFLEVKIQHLLSQSTEFLRATRHLFRKVSLLAFSLKLSGTDHPIIICGSD